MSNPRRSRWIGLIAIVAIVALLGAGWLLLRSRAALAPGASAGVGGSPARLPEPGRAPRAVGTGTAKLSWKPPEPAAAGTEAAVDPIAGFRVYVGPAPDALQLEASIDDPTATAYVVERLPKGIFFYTVTTYTRLGIESPAPTAVSKTIE